MIGQIKNIKKPIHPTICGNSNLITNIIDRKVPAIELKTTHKKAFIEKKIKVSMVFTGVIFFIIFFYMT